jgi:hemolysin activation/secretion protein
MQIKQKIFIFFTFLFLGVLPLIASADDVTFKGLLVTSRDINKPQPAYSNALKEEKTCHQSIKRRIVSLPALADEASIKAYREQLKAEGFVGIEPNLSGLNRAAIEKGLLGLQGQALDKKVIERAREEVLKALNAEGSILADIYLPPQRTDDGYLILVVAPAKLGKIVTTGQKYFDGAKIACEMRLQEGEQINLQTVTEDLQWLNRTPWRAVDTSYSPGENPGEADLILSTTDRKPLRPYVSFDNNGTRNTGLGRNKVGVSWGNAFGLFDHRLDYSYTESNYGSYLNSHALAYTLPVFNRTNLSFNLSKSKIDVPLEGGIFRSKGNNTSASVSLNRVLPSVSKLPSLIHEGTLGFEYKRIESSLLYGDLNLDELNNAPDIMQFYVDYSAGLSDKLGKTNSYTHLVLSPGFDAKHNTNEYFNKMRAGTSNDYWYVKQTLDRTFNLPKDWKVRGLLNAQYASERLMWSERMGLSGTNAVRGYYEDSYFADRGVVLNLELSAPTMNMSLAGKDAQLQMFVFRDWGKGYNIDDQFVSDLNNRSTSKTHVISSYGFGTRFSLSPYVQFNGTLGFADRGLRERGDAYLGNVSLVLGF